MSTTLQLHPMVLTVSGALALMAVPVHAQTFDVNSAAVRGAYLGPATQEKKDAALAGLTLLARQIPGPCPFSLCSQGGGVIIRQTPGQPFNFGPPWPQINSTILAENDGDFGVAGTVVTLNNTLLRTLASFSSPRDFSIGTGGARIDTNGFNFSILGTLTANGVLVKDGQGTLKVTGNNVWNQQPYVANGVLEGNAASLQTSILNNGTVRFNQATDGTYSGVISKAEPASGISFVIQLDPFGNVVSPQRAPTPNPFGNFEKTGSGKLTLSNAQAYGGTTTISGGTLALQGAGSLGNTSALSIDSGATFDISASSVSSHGGGQLSGAGNIVLGNNVLGVNSNNDSTFSGLISGNGVFVKGGTGNLTYTGAIDARYTTIASGTFSLVGAGRLNPLGNVYVSGGSFNLTDSVFVPGGVLDIANADGNREVGSMSGDGLVRLGNNTLTVGGDNSNQFFLGTVSGSGGLTKTGTGYWNLSGANTYTGVTTINQGNLISRAYSISDRVLNNATLTLTEEKGYPTPFVSAYSGNISGTGQLIKEGDGIIWLRGRNTYTGGTIVRDGVLIGNTDSLQGNITNNSGLAFYQVDNGTYAGNLSGTGTLLQYGPGTLTLTGNNTYTGGTAFSGTLRVDRDTNLGAASGALVMAGGTLQIGADMTTARNIVLAPAGGTFDTNGHRFAIGGQISGPGDLIKTGAGVLSLGNVSNYPGNTIVNLGRLEVNGGITSNVLVNANGEFGGAALVVGTLVNRGRLVVSNDSGDVIVSGKVVFEPGSVFSVNTNAAGSSGTLRLPDVNPSAHAKPGELVPLFILPVPGPDPALTPQTVTINGGTVDVRAENGNYNRQTLYRIITTYGGVNGQFNGITSNLAFLTPSLAYDPNNVYLTLTRNDLNYAAVAQNPNQSAVAQSLTRMTTVTTGDAATITTALDGLSAPQARAAFNSIGAAGRAALPQVGAVNQRSVNQNLVARLGIVEGGNSLAPATGIAGRAVQIAFDERIRSDAPTIYAQAMVPGSGQGLRADATSNTHNGFWLRGYGGAGRLDGDANSPGAKYNFGGTLFGYDRKVSEGATVGVFGGYAEPRYNQDVATSSAHTKTYQLGGYGRLNSGAWHVDGAASYARNSTDTSRVVTVGALNRAAAGSFKGDTVAVHVETGYTIKAGGFEVQPLAALSWVKQTQNAYSETGAGALSLVLPDQSQQSLRSTLGLRTLLPFQVGATNAVFEARAAWAHEFSNTRSINARLAGDPAASVFTVSGPTLPRDTAVVGVGIAAQASRNLRLYADVNGEFNGRERAATLSVGLRYQW